MKRLTFALSFVVLALAAGRASAQFVTTASQHDTLPLSQVDVLTLPALDRDAVAQEDLVREASGLPPRFAIPQAVSVTPYDRGTVEVLDGELLLWRLRIAAPGAANLNLGFTTYAMPESGQLMLYAADGSKVVRPFTSEDNASHGELWTPIVASDEVVVELTIPRQDFGALRLELTQVGQGYRGFGAKGDGAYQSGSCNVDVVCPQGDDWRAEIPAIGVISTGGSTFCTGFMVNNTSNDRTPYFMTANHCGIGPGNAASLVVYWNYETSTCGGPLDGELDEFNSGSFFRASYAPSDFTLVELDSDPDPAFEVTFAGWSRTGAVEPGAIAIHHPSTDEKRISFEFQPTSTTSYLGTAVPGDGTHVRVTDWDIGTTEPGSSGSPLFNPDHQVIGQLHGGYAACGNDLSDWYGAFAVSWNGGGTPSTRLSNWLDPTGTGALTVGTLGGGMVVTPSVAVAHEGPVGGPFSNPTTVYTLTNNSETPVDYEVALGNLVGVLLDGGTTPVTGTLAAGGGTAQVTVSLAASVASLPAGLYEEQILFEDQTNGLLTTRVHSLEIGRITLASVMMDGNPGWSMAGRWRYGTPLGGGGSSGNPDPTSGATGATCLGYNLTGDYANNEPEQHLTSTPFDLTGASGVRVSFQRWLNVETSTYDHAYFRVSSDGTNWTTVWQNAGEITDAAWSEQVFDISAIADGQATVYLRWTMGTTDGSLVYSGWNVDDVVLSGFADSPFEEYGAGLAGSGGFVPHLSGDGDTSIGGVFQLAVDDGLGGAFGAVMLGSQRASFPFYGGQLLVDLPLEFFFLTLGGAPGVAGDGAFSAPASITDPAFAGVLFQLQGIFVDGAAVQGYSLTQGLEVTVGS